MKKRQNDAWMQQWKDELDQRTPALDPIVRDAPIPPCTNHPPYGAKSAPQKENIRRMGLALACASLILVVTLVWFLIPREDPTAPPGALTPPAPSPMAVTVDINPAATFLTDADGTVTRVISLNQDADILRTTEGLDASLIGRPLDEAIVTFVDAAARLGYFTFAADASTAPDAVKISAASSLRPSPRFEEVSRSLESYFCEQGVFGIVAFDFPTADAFADRLNAAGLDVAHLFETADALDSFYGTRVAAGADQEEVSRLYGDLVTPGRIRALMEQEIRKNLDAIAESLHLLGEIDRCNEAIRNHADNPTAFLKGDYWHLLMLNHPDRYTADFAAQMADMQDLLDRYEADTGRRIESGTELNLLLAKYKFLDIHAELSVLKEKIEAFLNSEFAEECRAFFDFLTSGMREQIEALLTAPTTYEEYRSKLASYLSIENRARGESAKSDYEAPRDRITPEDYAAFKEEIEQKYGSVLDYFNQQAAPQN